MDKLFIDLLNMSLVGAFVIGIICLARLPLKRAPKIISYCLWIVAGIRLLVPFSIESGFGLVPFDTQPIPQQVLVGTPVIPIQLIHANYAISAIYEGQDLIPPQSVSSPAYALAPFSYLPVELIGELSSYGEIISYGNIMQQNWSFSQALQNIMTMIRSHNLQVASNWISVAIVIWLTGVIVMFIYGAITYVRLKNAMNGAILIDSNVYKADNIRTPFVLGILNPKIYLPADLPHHAHEYVLLHEKTHIRRYDYIVRFVAYLALCLHWFNPLVWLAFRLMGVDMEMSCDERVLKELGRDIRKDYSLTLVSMAVTNNMVASPLAFGGGGINKRVRNVLDFKKQPLLVVILAVVLTTVLGAGLLVNRTSAEAPTPFLHMGAESNNENLNEDWNNDEWIAEEWATDEWRREQWREQQRQQQLFLEMRPSEAYWLIVNDVYMQLQHFPSFDSDFIPPSRIEIPFVGRLAQVEEWGLENDITLEIMDFYRYSLPEYFSLEFFYSCESEMPPNLVPFEPFAVQFAVLKLFDKDGLHTESIVRLSPVNTETGISYVQAGDEVRYIDTWGNLWRMDIPNLTLIIPPPFDAEIVMYLSTNSVITIPMPPNYLPSIEITIHGGLRRIERIWVHEQLDMSIVASAEVSFVGTLAEIRAWEENTGMTGILNSRSLNPQVPENAILLAIDLLDANQNIVGRLIEHNVYPAIYRGFRVHIVTVDEFNEWYLFGRSFSQGYSPKTW